MATKTNTLKCEINTNLNQITFKECRRDADDKWEVLNQESFNWHDLPTASQEFVRLYGLRALLADRTSDAKRLGVDKLAWMKEVYADLHAGNIHKKRAGGAAGVDAALAHLISRLKKISLVEAEAALKAVPKETRDALAAKYAEDLAAIRKELANAEEVDLDDLLEDL